MFMPSGVAAAATGVLIEIPQLDSLSDPLTSVVAPAGGDRPIVDVRFQPNGDIEEAIGDTGAALNFVKVGEWLSTVPPIDNSDWEVEFSFAGNPPGDPGTWFGAALDVFHPMSLVRNFQWSKDDNSDGTAENVINCTMRQVSDIANVSVRTGLNYQAIISP